MSTRTIWANNLTQEYLKGLSEESKRVELLDYGYDADMLAPLSNEELNRLIDEDEYMWEIDAEDLENKIIPEINSQTMDGRVKFYSETNPEKSYVDYAESMIDPRGPNEQFLVKLEDVDGKAVATFEDGTQYILYAINEDEDVNADISTLQLITTNLTEQLNEAKVKDPAGLKAELEQIRPLVDEYGFEYFTSMPLVNFDNDPTSVEYQYPNFFKIVKAFFDEMNIIEDMDNIDELEDNWATFSQRDWDTCMTVCERCLETGMPYQIEKIYAATDNEEKPSEESIVDGDEMINLEESKLNEAEDFAEINCYLEVLLDLTKTNIDSAKKELKSLLYIPANATITEDDWNDGKNATITFEWMDKKVYRGDDEIGKYTEEGRVQENDEKILKDLDYVEDVDIFYDEMEDFNEGASKIKLNEGNAPSMLDSIRGEYLEDDLIINELMSYLSRSKRNEILDSICKDFDFSMNNDNSFVTWQEIWSTLGGEEFLDNIILKMSTEDLNKFAQTLIELYDLDELEEALIRKVRDKRNAIEAQMDKSIEEQPIKTPEEQLQEDLDNLLKEKNDGIIKCYRKNAGIRAGQEIPVDEDLDDYASNKTCMTYNISKDTLKEVLFSKENA